MTLISRAIDRLLASGYSSSEIADALGVTNRELRSLRTAEASTFLDQAPLEWYGILAEMAWDRAGLERLAHELEQS